MLPPNPQLRDVTKDGSPDDILPAWICSRALLIEAGRKQEMAPPQIRAPPRDFSADQRCDQPQEASAHLLN